MRRAWAAAAAALLAAACALPAQAQQTMPASGAPAAGRPLMLQAPPSDIGTPPNDDPRVAADPDEGKREGCIPAWPCRVQLFGVIERNGGIGLKGIALTW
jgi:hypothetical protein